MYALLLAAAVIPPALLVVALASSLGRPLSWSRLALVFGLGAALLMPVYGLLDVHDWLGVELGNDPYPKGLYRGFVLASLPEELCRFFLTWACAAWCMRGREAGGAFAPAIVCGVAVMLGFASLENCVYVYNRGWDVSPEQYAALLETISAFFTAMQFAFRVDEGAVDYGPRDQAAPDNRRGMLILGAVFAMCVLAILLTAWLR